MKTVFFINEFGVQEGIPREFLGVPFVIDEDGQPDSRINEYLLARRNGDWERKVRQLGHAPELLGRNALRADLTFLRNRVYQLDVFRRWVAREGKSLAAVQNSELDQFAEDLEEGLVTGFEGGLQPSTVNQYLVSVIDFLQYGAFVGWREPLSLVFSKGKAGKTKSMRPLVLRRVNPAELKTWYTQPQIEEFLATFDSIPIRIVARIMYEMGLRISEVLNLTVSELPNSGEVQRDPARRRIKVTGKFRKTRWVPIEIDLLIAIERFVAFERKIYARKCKMPTDRLIIGPKDSDAAGPLKARSVQKAFVAAREAAGFAALSPHLLRHHFAAHYLLKAWRAKTVRVSTPQCVDTTVASSLLSTELLILKEALGHENFDTTLKYLHAISYLMGSALPEQYASALDPEDEQ